ncbi:hypothetical protein BGX38DRAFT_867462 [Terfezia claveryi]|nr:hypothetical protein BGX38DRAFT_867462 [Terfezia claveryi]
MEGVLVCIIFWHRSLIACLTTAWVSRLRRNVQRHKTYEGFYQLQWRACCDGHRVGALIGVDVNLRNVSLQLHFFQVFSVEGVGFVSSSLVLMSIKYLMLLLHLVLTYCANEIP